MTKSGQTRSVSLEGMSSPPTVMGGVIGTTLTAQFGPSDDVVLKGAAGADALAFAEGVKAAGISFNLAALEREADRFDNVYAAIVALGQPARYPAACSIDPHQHRRLARQQSSKPCARPGRGVDMPFVDDAVGPDDQQPPEGSLTHLRVAQRRCMPSVECCRGTKAKPGRKVACLAECLGWRSQDRDGLGDERRILGTAISRRASAFSFARREISASSFLISASRWASAPTSTFSVTLALARRPLSGFSMAIRRTAFVAPCGTTCLTRLGGRTGR